MCARRLDMNWRGAKWSGHPEQECLYNNTNRSLFPSGMGPFLSFEHHAGVTGYLNDHPCKCTERPPLPGHKKCEGGGDPVSPEEIQFRYEGLTTLLKQGLDFWYACVVICLSILLILQVQSERVPLLTCTAAVCTKHTHTHTQTRLLGWWFWQVV